jgi:hypothetical protein
MKKYRFEVAIAIILILAAMLIYCLHVLIFNDLHHLVIYGLEDLAFLPLEVLLVTLVLDRLLELRGKNERNSKINMIIGTYFTEIGNSVFKIFSDADSNKDMICNNLSIKPIWKNKNFKKAFDTAKKHKISLQLTDKQFESIKNILASRRELLVNLTQNPALLEHGSFSNLLLATFHLSDELGYRKDFTTLPDQDLDHLNFDAKRVYSELLLEWVKYMKHLNNNYPYLYSLSCRTNPLEENNEVICR